MEASHVDVDWIIHSDLPGSVHKVSTRHEVMHPGIDLLVRHTIEELQEFSNMRTPSPPWVHVVRLSVPMSCCDEAAKHLIKALGGEEMTKKTVGGTKWWQVRGFNG